MVLVHGGFWRAGYGPELEHDLARELSGRGFGVWNIDYRASDAGWPATLEDAAAGLDYLRSSSLAERLDLDRVAVMGHSAGGQLALWLASRSRIPVGSPGAASPTSVRVRLAVGQAPVADLVAAAGAGLGGGAVAALLGGQPREVPERYAAASPAALLPPDDGAAVLLVHGGGDDVVPVTQSEAYAAAAQAAGAGPAVRLRVLPGLGHFEHLDPTSSAFGPVQAALGKL